MKTKQKISSTQAMLLAIKEAKKGSGLVEPNPPVGCVILDSHYNFISASYHKKYGDNHAEVEALNKIKNKKLLKGAHVFITLEPCHHVGKTPSCAKALAKYSINSITYGTEDHFTYKKGLEYLQKKGINIIRSYDFQKELESLIEIFKFNQIHKKTFVSLKMASSLDGIIALKNGDSQWITCKKSREHVHFLRATHSAVLIGVDTLLQDNPKCNIRINSFKNKKNKVIILDPSGKSLSFLQSSLLLQSHSLEDIIICCSDEIKIKTSCLGVKVKLFSKKYFQKNKTRVFLLDSILQNLYQEEQIQSVLVEGGAFCWSQFLQQQRAQKLYLYMAPKIIGMGKGWSQHFNIQNLKQSINVDSIKITPVGEDFILEGNINA